ncbi:MAG: hypothetical protein KDD50_10745, partial [Bdellovibrionales bacterium]|nr:hypothetical protein [Bdellovibrionales bacterium]
SNRKMDFSVFKMSRDLSDFPEAYLQEKFRITESRLKVVFGEQYSLRDFYIIGNFFHGFNPDGTGRHYIAIIPKSVKIVRVTVQQSHSYLMDMGVTSQLRFELNQPLLLLPQEYKPSSDWHKKPLMTRGDVVFSQVKFGVEGSKTGPEPSFEYTGRFATGYMFGSMYTFGRRQVDHGLVAQGFLDLSNTQNSELMMQNIFRYALKKTEKAREGEIFNPVFNNSTRAMIDVLRAEGHGLALQSDHFNPYQMYSLLLARGYMDPNGKSETLNQEYTINAKIPLKGMAGLIFQMNARYYPLMASTVIDRVLRELAFSSIENEFSAWEFRVMIDALAYMPSGIERLDVSLYLADYFSANNENLTYISLKKQKAMKSTIKNIVNIFESERMPFYDEVFWIVRDFSI